ncbi:hypothetical protein [Catenovulum sediminis]|uniref:Right handed beta helix domain-containing protein n=1 Tax=Catenovulum sediminis TaxID=1740262 RepID=A0ABV1RFY3_9ALTE|nr:hypothetical protein [Catenovulum sediminis]
MMRLLCAIKLIFILAVMQVYASEIASNHIVVDGRSYSSMQAVEKAIKNYSQVYIGPGTYTEGLHIKANNVTISGSSGTHFQGAVIKGKGTFVVSGNDTRIENLECSLVEVPSQNGACIRQEGKNLTVFGVYFHDAEQGILQNPNTGSLTVQFSRFENLGKSGRAHAIYAQGDTLLISDSEFIASKDEGHEIKSRAKNTHITNSLIASKNSRDSRLIDVPNGGIFILENCILQQGNATANRNAIGYALELKEEYKNKRKHAVLIQNNIIILERERGNLLFSSGKYKFAGKITIQNNVLIGKIVDIERYRDNNTHFTDRNHARLKNETLPQVSQLTQLIDLLTGANEEAL